MAATFHQSTSRRVIMEMEQNGLAKFLLHIKVKISLLQAVEAHRVARGQGSHIS
jgi:hypothetical protein